jgi:hypothetical protein
VHRFIGGSYGNISGGADLAATTISGAGGNGGYSSYEQSSYSSSGGGGGGTGAFDANVTSGIDLAGAAAGASSSSSSFEASNTQQHVQQYPTNAQGLFQDPNPQIIRRPAQGGHVTYTQNIKIRFLQPPAVPPPGVSLFSHPFNLYIGLILATNH